METRKINLDRKPLDTEYIQSKQNFQEILSHHKIAKIPVWKKPLFYGVVGVASVAAVVTVASVNFDNSTIESKPLTSSNLQLASAQIDKTFEIPVAKTAAFSNVDLPAKPASSVRKDASDKTATEEISNKPEVNELVLVEEKAMIQAAPVVEKKKSKLPSLSGKFEGNLSVSQMCGDPEIRFANENIKVLSYNLHLTQGTEGVTIRVSGNKIPSYLCEALQEDQRDGLLFITDIETTGGQEPFFVPAMNFQLIASH